jgi:hypothetical protein
MTGIYDLEYFENMLKKYSKTAERISKIRWQFIADINPVKVLDYGSGVGWFRAFRPGHVIVDSYDIATYPQTGIRNEEYDVVCLWDVLEHIPNFSEIENILKIAKYVAITIPIKPVEIELTEWKHFKPLEHLHYFNKETVNSLLAKYKFKLIKEGKPECPPRQDVWSMLYEYIAVQGKGGANESASKKKAKKSKK